MQIIKKFSSDQDRKIYLDSIENHKEFSLHPATRFAQQFAIDPVDPILKKFQDQPPRVRQIAKAAYQTYQDTIHQPNEKAAKKFAVVWPSAERFVSYVVEESNNDPDFLNKLTT